MSSVLWQSTPTELMVRILQSCDSLAQIKALILTCRHFYSAWVAHAPLIIWTVAPKVIPAFEEALMVARATRQVQEAQDSGKFPTLGIQITDLTGHSRKPSLAEFRAVLDLDHLIQCVEIKYYHHGLPDFYDYFCGAMRWPVDRRPGPPECLPEKPEGMRKWTRRFYRAMYLALLMGALLAGAYNKPFVLDPESPIDTNPEGKERQQGLRRRQRLVAKMLQFQNDNDAQGFGLTAKDTQYLRQFPAYDLNGDLDKHEKVFGPVSKWLVDSTLDKLRDQPPVTECPTRSIQGHRNNTEPRGFLATPHTYRRDHRGFFRHFAQGSEAEAEGVLWVVMQTIHAFEFLLLCFINHDGREGFWRGEESELPTFSGRTREVPIVLFGIFQVEEITLPENISEAVECSLPARSLFPSHEPEHEQNTQHPLPSLDIPLVLDALYLWSGMPNHDGEYPAPPPPLQFFTFLLHKHFNVQFWPRAFDTSDPEYQAYREFKARATLFSNDFEDVPERMWMDCTNGSEVLVEYSLRALRYKEQRSNPRNFEEFS